MRDDLTPLEERTLRQLLERAADELPPLSDEELALAARAAANGDREHVLQLDGRRRATARRSTRPARWALALAATVGLALLGGVGLGRQLAPVAESAQAPVLPALAPGFAPAGGWTTVEDGIDVPAGTRAALSANVPLDAHEPLELPPGDVLASLPPSGIVVAVAGRDAERSTAASEPLRLAGAERATRWEGPEGTERALAEYVLRGSANGLELEVRVYFGSPEPSRAQLAAAQAQLDRLVVRQAASEVTIAARPSSVRWGEPVNLSGAVAGGKAGERVMIEMRECGTSYWRAHAAATTTSGGQWFAESSVPINGVLRARTDSATSGAIRVATRPGVSLQGIDRRPYAYVTSVRSMMRREVVLQRFDARGQRWVVVSRVRVAESGGGGNFIWGTARFANTRLARGTLYRATMSNEATGPCYLAGVSDAMRR